MKLMKKLGLHQKPEYKAMQLDMIINASSHGDCLILDRFCQLLEGLNKA